MTADFISDRKTVRKHRKGKKHTVHWLINMKANNDELQNNQKTSYSSPSDSIMPTSEKNIELFFMCFWFSYFFYSIFLYASTEIGPKVFLFSWMPLNGSILRRFVVDLIDIIEELEIMLIFILSDGLLFYLLLKTWLLLVLRVTLNFFFFAKFRLTFMKFLRFNGSYVFSFIFYSKLVLIHCTNSKLSWYFIFTSFWTYFMGSFVLRSFCQCPACRSCFEGFWNCVGNQLLFWHPT